MNREARELIAIAKGLLASPAFSGLDDVKKALKAMGEDVVSGARGETGWVIHEPYRDEMGSVMFIVYVGPMDSWYSDRFEVNQSMTMSQFRSLVQKVKAKAAPALLRREKEIEGYREWHRQTYPRGVPAWPHVPD